MINIASFISHEIVNRNIAVLGSEEKLEVAFYTAGEENAGELFVWFTSTPGYYIQKCTSYYTEFPTTLPTATVKVWRFTVIRNSGTRVVIHCNDQEVANILLSSSTCSVSNWSSRWSRKIAKLHFSSNHKAADYYRPFTGKHV